jgi:hypothetical protein
MQPETYVYQSEGGHGQRTFVATCTVHARDMCIHPNLQKAEKVARAHKRIWHDVEKVARS